MSTTASAVPWTRAQLRFTVAANAMGLALIVVAGLGTRGTSSLSRQIGWMNLAVIGLVLAAAAHGGLLFFGRRAVGRRRQQVIPDVAVVAGPAVTALGEAVWLWVPGTRRAHRPGCLLVADRAASPVDAAEIRAAALERCEMCG